MSWADDMIWWHVYPLGFVGAPIREGDRSLTPRLRRLLPWLDHVTELGCTGLLLGPVFDSSTHGYDTLDHYRVDPRLGSDEDLQELIDTCHAKGLRILFDGVFSHVGEQHMWVGQALLEGAESPAGRMLDIDWEAEGGPTARVFEGHGSLVRLRHENAEVVHFTADVMEYWLARGLDGWRLDAAYSVPTWFWAQVLPRVRRSFPQAWILGEVIHGELDEFVTESTVDTVTQYQLWKPIWSSLKEKNLWELEDALRRHNRFIETFTPQTFVGNHDVTRIATVVGQDNAITALAILMTVGGIPSIYSGDEVGMTGLKEERLGGDDAVRPEFPLSPADLPRASHGGSPDWPEGSGMGGPVWRAHLDLIALRRAIPWLRRARTETLSVENPRLSYRTWAEDRQAWIDVQIDLESADRVRVIDEGGAVLWAQRA